MSSTMDRFDQLVAKSPLKTNLASKTYDIINNIIIPCEEIESFYQDSLFYMHLYNSLYIELMNFDIANGNSINALTDVINNLHITFDNTVENTGADNSVVKMGSLVSPTVPDTKYIFTFYLKNFKNYYHNDYAYAYINSMISSSNSGNRKFSFLIKLPTDSVESLGGQDAEAEITVNMQTGVLTAYDTNVYIKVIKGGSGFFKSQSSGISGNLVIKNSDMPIPLVKLGNYGIFKEYFPDGITDLEFTIKNGIIIGIKPLVKGSDTQVTSVRLGAGNTMVDKYKPKIDNIVLLKYDSANENDSSKTFLMQTGSTGIIDDTPAVTIGNIQDIKYFTKTGNYSLNENIEEMTLTLPSRRKRFRKIISEILKTPVQNIFSYLLYQKIYYNCIVCNTSIQLLLRREYLNKESFGSSSKKLEDFRETDKTTLEGFAGPIISHISRMTDNINELRKIAELASKDYVINKDYYANRINTLNETRDIYNESLESLNNVLSNYNQYIHYYQKLKKYASAIIIFLIILIIVTITITVLPMFDFNAKNTYYIIILILLIILTYFYYINFKHVSLYEKFYTPSPGSSAVNKNRGSITGDGSGNYILSRLDCNIKTGDKVYDPTLPGSDSQTLRLNNNNSHIIICNKIFLSTELQRYNITYTALNDGMSSIMYIANNKTFSNDANMYLYKLYLDKKRRGDINKLKKTNFANIIESIKKQITYLFNIILLISFITIILLISLIWFNIATSHINYIFAFAIISIAIIMFYFNSAIIQPTRMIARKNYWSNNNPSKDSLNAL